MTADWLYGHHGNWFLSNFEKYNQYKIIIMNINEKIVTSVFFPETQ